jgi:hypothetical protein
MTGLVRVLCERPDRSTPWCFVPAQVRVYYLRPCRAAIRAFVMRARGWRVETTRI